MEDLPTSEPELSPLVSVFSTDDMALLPLAQMALHEDGIPFVVQNIGRGLENMGWALTPPATNRPRTVELMVTEDVAARAKELLADLDQAESAALLPTDPASLTEPDETGPIRLENAETGAVLGTLTESQLQELISHLEEDPPGEYFVDASSIETLEHARVEPAVVDLVRQAVGEGEGVRIRWSVPPYSL